MLFAIIYRNRSDWSEEKQNRVLKVFGNWKPPAGLEFKSHYDFANDGGGVLIAEASSAAALLEATLPFTPYFEFETIPIVEISESVAIGQRALAWRNSIR